MVRRRVERAGGLIRQHDKTAIGLEAGRDRPLHVVRVEGVDVLVDDPDMLEAAVTAERGRNRGLAGVRAVLGDLNDCMEPRRRRRG